MTMTRREICEVIVGAGRNMDPLGDELRALWAVLDEYQAAIDRLGGTTPPALDAYHDGEAQDVIPADEREL